MSQRARNIAVGVTVLVALGMVGAMILLFTVLPAVFQGGYPIRMQADSKYGMEPGLPIHFANMKVGTITDVQFTDPADLTKGVTFTALVDKKIRLPGNVNVHVSTVGFVGSPYIELTATGPALLDPKTGRPLAYLPTDGSIALQVTHMGSDMIPNELKQTLEDIRSGFKDLGSMARTLNTILAPDSAASGPADPNTVPPPGSPAAEARTMLSKLGRALDGLVVIVGDPNNQANIKESLANLAQVSRQGVELMGTLKGALEQAQKTLEKADGAIAKVSGTVDKAGQSFDQLSVKLMGSADQLAVLLGSLNRIASRLETSEGTAGKLLNDPKLYNNLLEITNQLTSLMKEFRVLVETWEKSGVGIKLK